MEAICFAPVWHSLLAQKKKQKKLHTSSFKYNLFKIWIQQGMMTEQIDNTEVGDFHVQEYALFQNEVQEFFHNTFNKINYTQTPEEKKKSSDVKLSI